MHTKLLEVLDEERGQDPNDRDGQDEAESEQGLLTFGPVGHR